MLAILFLLVIGKPFAYLARVNGKNQWLYGILGIVCYYIIGLICSALFVLCIDFFDYAIDPDEEDFYLVTVTIVGGIIGCIFVYQLLKYQWKEKADSTEIIDQL